MERTKRFTSFWIENDATEIWLASFSEHQAQDGTWWDCALYNYHQQHGTAFALLSLEHCRDSVSTSGAIGRTT
jgi:hypothetical protein